MASDPTRLVQKGKRKVKRVLFSRTAIIVLLLLLQLFYLLGIFGRLRSFLPYTYGGMLLLNLVAILVIVNRKGNPSYKLAWMLPVTLLPVFGIFLYLFLDYQLGRRLVYYRQNKLEKGLTAQDCQKAEVFERLQQKDAGLANLSRYLYQRGHFPVYQNTKVRYFPSGEAMFEVMLERLETAESFIFMEYFSFEDCGMWNTLLEVLSRKAAEGVEVRFMYDGTCSARYGDPVQGFQSDRTCPFHGAEQQGSPEDHGDRRTHRVYRRDQSGGCLHQRGGALRLLEGYGGAFGGRGGQKLYLHVPAGLADLEAEGGNGGDRRVPLLSQAG